ncbi:hypothetical protein CRG98_002820 [Punica granatum]|uniref:Reverse transcriptase Ty1/copia-type domain-containing protein n=1 Tax=Punica granatum TaxID=22663 RepID=A0A2I0L7Z6_PUNGR|nr:hypothetical protein CRG98_002820 [Punica granatum]
MGVDIDSRKSISGYLMTFAGGAILWQFRLQKCIALSTTEAEYIAVTKLWLQKFLQELSLKQERYVLHYDSQSAIHLCKNPNFHSRSKHIDTKFHWIRDVLETKLVKLDKVHTDENGTDMMTKPLAKEKLHVCWNIVGMFEASK